MNEAILAQIVQAYERMGNEAGYRPGAGDKRTNLAPSVIPDDELSWFAQQWWDEEEQGTYWLGVPDFSNRSAMIYMLWAIRAMNGEGSAETSEKLMRMAIEELRQTS